MQTHEEIYLFSWALRASSISFPIRNWTILSVWFSFLLFYCFSVSTLTAFQCFLQDTKLGWNLLFESMFRKENVRFYQWHELRSLHFQLPKVPQTFGANSLILVLSTKIAHVAVPLQSALSLRSSAFFKTLNLVGTCYLNPCFAKRMLGSINDTNYVRFISNFQRFSEPLEIIRWFWYYRPKSLMSQSPFSQHSHYVPVLSPGHSMVK